MSHCLQLSFVCDFIFSTAVLLHVRFFTHGHLCLLARLLLAPGLSLKPRFWVFFTMTHLTPLAGLKDAMEGSDDWRLSVQVLASSDPRPSVLESCVIRVPPDSSLYDVIQMLEHGGGLHSKAVGIHLVIQAESGPSESITAFPIPLVAREALPSSGATSSVTPSLAAGPVLTLAQTLEAHHLLSSEKESLVQLATQIHARLTQNRAVSYVSDEYSAMAWLTTRAYMAYALDELPVALHGRAATDDRPMDPPSVDEPGLN